MKCVREKQIGGHVIIEQTKQEKLKISNELLVNFLVGVKTKGIYGESVK